MLKLIKKYFKKKTTENELRQEIVKLKSSIVELQLTTNLLLKSNYKLINFNKKLTNKKREENFLIEQENLNNELKETLQNILKRIQ